MISENYGLRFEIRTSEVFDSPVPSIIASRTTDGTTPFGVLAYFFSSEGIIGSNDLLIQINELVQKNNFPVRFLGPYDDDAEITNNPLEISFYPSSSDDRLKLPLDDFISIINEWILFLESIPYEHLLSNS